MSTYVLMRILESAPQRYDLGIRLLSFGRVGVAYDRLTGHVQPGQRVLDLGCGTGALTLRAAQRGARVKGIDTNPEMLEIARQRARAEGLEERVELAEMGVAELDAEATGSYDAVLCGLCFSELGPDERAYALAQAARVLRPGGLLLVADEVEPAQRSARIVRSLVRAPLVVLTYAITQQTTRPLADLPGNVRAAGLTLVSQQTNRLGSFMELVARKTAGAAA